MAELFIMQKNNFISKVFQKIFRKKSKDGPFEDCHENGLVLQKGILKNGKLEGISTFYYRSGELAEISFYDDARIRWSRSFYKSGNLQTKTIYDDKTFFDEEPEHKIFTFPDKKK